ncbi:MAG TPA: 50S ribosomal protein L4 [Candidatus Paceibacterota bacterium]|nr:50S ribosomal protein L4 [Candidatus Paceibacterota bacterium]
MEAKIYNNKGVASGSVKLPEKIFGVKWNSDLVSQTLNSMRSSQRAGTADAKGRGDVRGGGKKPWKQKGTGRARHGSTRSPIWVGGGVAHGPKAEKNYDRKVNKKARNKALFTLLSAKFKDGELLFIDNIETKDIKTKNAALTLQNLSKIEGYNQLNYKKGNRALIVTPTKSDNTIKSFRNLNTVAVEETRNMDPLTVAKYKYIIVSNPEESVKILSARS